jgi:hypothetical protein
MIGAMPTTDRRVSPFVSLRSAPRARWECAGFLAIQALVWLIASHVVAGFSFLGLAIPAPVGFGLGPGAAAVFVPIPSLVALAGAVAILSRRRGCWHLAMVAQSSSLLTCFVAYVGDRPGIVFPLMLGCIFLALYLNSNDVRHDLEGSHLGCPHRSRLSSEPHAHSLNVRPVPHEPIRVH